MLAYVACNKPIALSISSRCAGPNRRGAFFLNSAFSAVKPIDRPAALSDVIVSPSFFMERWKTAAGKTAVLAADQRTFAEVKARRTPKAA